MLRSNSMTEIGGMVTEDVNEETTIIGVVQLHLGARTVEPVAAAAVAGAVTGDREYNREMAILSPRNKQIQSLVLMRSTTTPCFDRHLRAHQKVIQMLEASKLQKISQLRHQLQLRLRRNLKRRLKTYRYSVRISNSSSSSR